MSLTEKAFQTGSEFPALKPGLLRLYSMRFCPYAQRTRIVLLYKNIEHETVNIHLKNKPEWYLEKVNPLGKVPAIQNDDKVIFDSTIICEYLDSIYPTNRLTPSDPFQLAQDKMLVEMWSNVIGSLYKLYFSKEENLELIQDIWRALDPIEAELKKRNTSFFGGDKPMMVDMLLWPHAERIFAFAALEPYMKLDENRFSHFLSWRDKISTIDAVKKTNTPLEVFKKFLASMKSGNADYDMGLD